MSHWLSLSKPSSEFAIFGRKMPIPEEFFLL